jgi:dihydroxyacetone kinase-like protein
MMDADFFRAWITAIADVVDEQRDYLTQLDAAIGDADHGTNLARGFGAVREALAKTETRTPGAVLRLTGTTLISTVGGASGPLYGTAFRRAAKSLGDAEDVGLSALAEALAAALEGVTELGAAREGEKTMVDTLAPAVAAFTKAVTDGPVAGGPGTGGADPGAALGALADAAAAGARATVEMQALKGRASYLGPRSVGHEDPGAASTALMLRALLGVATRPRQAS